MMEMMDWLFAAFLAAMLTHILGDASKLSNSLWVLVPIWITLFGFLQVLIKALRFLERDEKRWKLEEDMKKHRDAGDL